MNIVGNINNLGNPDPQNINYPNNYPNVNNLNMNTLNMNNPNMNNSKDNDINKDKIKKLLKKNKCYEQHIVSIKETYENYLISIITPVLYEGFQSIYKNSVQLEKKYIEASKNNPNIENPGVLVIFQMLVKGIPNLNNHKIKKETDRIKAGSRNADIFDDLIKAVIKSNIILLTFNVDHQRKEIINSNFHSNIVTHDFIHNCYIECAKNLHGYPELFWHLYDPIEINRNKRETKKIIEKSVLDAIHKMLPMKEILLEYLTYKYDNSTHTSDSDYDDVKYGMNNDFGSNKKILLSTSDEFDDNTKENNGNNNSNNNVNNDEYVNMRDLINSKNDDNSNNEDNGILLTTDKTDDSNSNKSDSKIDSNPKDPNYGFVIDKNNSNKNEEDKKDDNEEKEEKSSSSGVRIIDIPSINGKSKEGKFFGEVMKDISKSEALKKYTKDKEEKQDNENKDKEEKENKDDDIEINITKSDKNIETTQKNMGNSVNNINSILR